MSDYVSNGMVKVDRPTRRFFITVTVTHDDRRNGRKRSQAARVDPTNDELLDMTMGCLRDVLRMCGLTRYTTGIRIDYGGFWNDSPVTWVPKDQAG